MSRLEAIAKPVLTPLILGRRAMVEPIDSGPIAAWTQKTALVAMLVSSEEERAGGYGLPPSEYREMYAQRETLAPLPASQFWIGRYAGQGDAAFQQVTPLVVQVDGIAEPAGPQAYLMSIVLGQLLLAGVRFTTSALQLELFTRQELPQLWPSGLGVEWPRGIALCDEGILGFCGGKDLESRVPHTAVAPWKAATDLVQSRLVGGMVELQTICGKHVVYYPAILAHEAMVNATFHAFVTSCECDIAYLVETQADGAHCKAAGDVEAIRARYDALPGHELRIEDGGGVFECKRLG